MKDNLKDYLYKVYKKIEKENLEPEEVISEDLKTLSYNYLNSMTLDTAGDLFLYFAALNLLNRYVKQNKDNDDNISYSFKSKLEEGILALVNIGDKDTYFNIKQDYKKNPPTTLIVLLGDIMFSFHTTIAHGSIDYAQFMGWNSKPIEWDNISKQKRAVTLFSSAILCPERSNTTLFRDNLDKYVLEQLNSKKEEIKKR